MKFPPFGLFVGLAFFAAYIGIPNPILVAVACIALLFSGKKKR